MKKSLFTQKIKRSILAVPACALMLGAAQAGTTVGLNFQTWYYDSGANPQTIGFNNGYSAYNTTGFPVTAKAFGVMPANWFNTDPLHGNPNSNPPAYPINQACTFGGTATNFAGGLSCYVNSPVGGFQSGSGCEFKSGITYPSYAPGVFCPQGNDEALWGIIVGKDNSPTNEFSITVSGLAAKFPNGYVIQSMAALGNGKYALLPRVDFTDGVTTNTAAYHVWYIQNAPGAQWPSTTAGLSDSSGVFTTNTLSINSRADNTGLMSCLAGFIITDEAVISQDPAGGSFVVNQPINLSVGAIGLPPLSYQWRSNGIPITGATTATYSITNAPVSTNTYDVIVTNLYGAATSAVATVTVALPVTLTWDANTGTTGAQDGSGNWDNGITASWWNVTNDVVWGSFDNAVFGVGGTGAYTVVVTNSVIANNLTFNSGNYTLSGANGSTVTLVGTSQINANTNVTISLPLAGTSGVTKNGTGTLTLNTPETYSGSSIVNAGTVNLAYNSGATGTLPGGALVINTNATVITTVNNALGYNGSVNWVQNITLNYSTLETSVTTDNGWGTTINMTGGTLGATVPGGYFAMGDGPVFNVTGVNVPSVISANLTDRDGTSGIVFNLTRGTAAVDLNVSGSILSASGGGITVNGNGIMQLDGANTYTGPTIVNGGTLNVVGQLTGNGAVTLMDGTTLNTTAAGTSAAITTASLTLGTSGTSVNTLGFAGLDNTTVAPISVGGSLAYTNPLTVNIYGAIPAVGQYPLIQYNGGETLTNILTLGTLPPGVSATLVDDHVSSVSLNVTATPVQTELWTGTPNGNWDINNTANWLIGAVASTWGETNIATFDDTASGTTTITLNTNVHPALVIFTNMTRSYSISGTGSIAGGTSVSLIGGGLVTFSNVNTYFGGTIINGGTLSVGADSSLGTGSLSLNGGTLDITGTNAFTSAKSVALNGNSTIQVDNTAGASFPPINGSGGLTKNGNGTLRFSANQPYTGGTTVNAGILDLTGGGGSAGVLRGMVTINTNAVLKVDTGDAEGYAGGANAINTLYLTGGTLYVNTTANQTLGSATIIMTGGTITGLPGANLDFFGGASALDTFASSTPSVISSMKISPLRQGSTTFDVQAGTTPNGIDLDISSVLQAKSDPVGSILYKADTGTMRLSAVNTYTGGTEVQGGTLILSGRLIGGGLVNVDDTATLDVVGGINSAIVTTNDLTLGTGGTLTLGFANISSPTVPLVSVGNVVLNDAVTVNISGKVGVGQFPLIKYAGTNSGTGSFTLGTLPAGVSASLSNNVVGQSLDLVVTSAPLSIITDISSGTNYVYAGTTYNLVVAAGGNPTLGYQWYHNNTPIPGATATSLSLPRITAASDGSYYVIVTNASGSVSSSTNTVVVLPVSGYPAMVIATGPTAFWPLNETNGPTAIDYMGGHNGGYSGGGVTYNVAGPVGATVVTVNGSSGQVAAPYSPDLNPSAAFTAEAWLNPASVSSSLACALSSSHAASPRAGWLIYCSTAGWEFRTYNQNGLNTAVDIKGGTPTVGTWNHVVVEWDGSKGYIYVNGVLQSTSAATTYVANGDSPVTIGSRSDSAFYWGGSVGDVAFYNRLLTPQEIQTHAQNSPSLQITPAGGKVVVSWVPSGGGSLVASPVVTGPYTNVPTATSPWTNTPSGNQFYRIGF